MLLLMMSIFILALQCIYSKTYVKRPLKIRQNTKILMTNGSLMKVESIVECYILDLH